MYSHAHNQNRNDCENNDNKNKMKRKKYINDIKGQIDVMRDVQQAKNRRANQK